MEMRTKFIVGMMSGAILGSVVGLLMAPKSGKETREAVRQQIGRFNRVVRSGFGRRLAPVDARRSSEADYLR